MLALSSLLLALGSATAVVAQEALCDGLRNPDYEACDATVASWLEEGKTFEPPKSENCQGEFPQYCCLDFSGIGNCVASICFDQPTANYPPVNGKGAWLVYSRLKSFCGASDAGGQSLYQQGINIQVYNNPDFPGKRSLPAPRNIGHPHARRQQEGDDKYEPRIKNINVVKDEERRLILGLVPSGSSYMIQETDSETVGISSTAELGVSFFEIFSASVSITTSYDKTVSNTKGITINVDCPEGQQGSIYWVPRFDRYDGKWLPSGQETTIWIPLDDGAGNYETQCVDP